MDAAILGLSRARDDTPLVGSIQEQSRFFILEFSIRHSPQPTGHTPHLTPVSHKERLRRTCINRSSAIVKFKRTVLTVTLPTPLNKRTTQSQLVTHLANPPKNKR